MTRRLPWLAFALALAVVGTAEGCGARSALEGGKSSAVTAAGPGGAGGLGGGGAGGLGGGGVGGLGGGGAGGLGGGGSGGAEPLCQDGATRSCGNDVGACKQGVQLCAAAAWGSCSGSVEPTEELCNGADDDCDGETDEGFKLGAACDGSDTDLCTDDVITCAGCSPGPNNVESCNGKDDNCNGTVDSDCDIGACKPALLVTGSKPSNPNCVDFPVEKGSAGVIFYPCSGGDVKATLGSLVFSGTVKNGAVSLSATGSYLGPDGCTWQTKHTISGVLAQGTLNYFYSEAPIAGMNCWQACTETGVVQVSW